MNADHKPVKHLVYDRRCYVTIHCDWCDPVAGRYSMCEECRPVFRWWEKHRRESMRFIERYRETGDITSICALADWVQDDGGNEDYVVALREYIEEVERTRIEKGEGIYTEPQRA